MFSRLRKIISNAEAKTKGTKIQVGNSGIEGEGVSEADGCSIGEGESDKVELVDGFHESEASGVLVGVWVVDCEGFEVVVGKIDWFEG